jgi:predicted AAA+ superfamily ATPase
MPKVYFYDLGFRNALLKNFDNIKLRVDKWNTLENIYFREFLFKYWLENIKFWRTQNKNEVDFIIEEKKAYEIKFNKKLIKESKYELFRKNYPEFNLEFLTYDDVISFVIKN